MGLFDAFIILHYPGITSLTLFAVVLLSPRTTASLSHPNVLLPS
jgi:hypothetical protein